MLENGFTRTDCVVAVGGGVVGDLAGFAAASFMRGIDFYNIPTTVLSQVDSSVGGKVAIDMNNIKNCVGAFHQPKAVLIDPDVLNTLPPRQIANGLAEAVKMAITFDETLLSVFEQEDYMEHIDEIITASVRLKAEVVRQDEKESGLRRVLNFGHTIGHGIETAAGLDKLYHGECVALGMLPMCAPKVRERLKAVLQKAGLPIETDLDIEVALSAVSHDKKMDKQKINYVFCPEIGAFEFCSADLQAYAEMVKTSGAYEGADA
jgi:3-dehydroquinate synthase